MLRTTEIPYVYSRDGIFYFTRRIPNDLKGYYRCPRLVLSLRTKKFMPPAELQERLAGSFSVREEEALCFLWFHQKIRPKFAKNFRGWCMLTLISRTTGAVSSHLTQTVCKILSVTNDL